MIIKRVFHWQVEKPLQADLTWILEKNLWQRIDGTENETTITSMVSRKRAKRRQKI
jgi:hypothetical protein